MRTWKQLADLVLVRYYGGAIVDDKKVTRRQAMIHLQQARDAKIKRDLFEMMKTGNRNPSPDFFKPFTLKIKWDTAQEVCYTDLTAQVASLPHDKGIGEVREPKDIYGGWIRVGNFSKSLIPDMVQHAEGNYVWELTSNMRLDFPNINKTWEDKDIRVSMIAVGDASDNEDESTRMPSDFEEEVVASVLKLLRGTRTPADESNNNRDEPSN